MTETTPSAPVTTGSTLQAASPQAPVKMYDNWEVAGIIAGGAVAAIVAVKTLFEVIEAISRFFKRKREDDQELITPIDARLKSLEDRMDKVRASDYIDRELNRLDQKIDHEKNNRQGVIESILVQLRRIEERQEQDRLALIRLETRTETLANNSQRVEKAVELLRERIDERFDRFHEMLSQKGTSGK